MGKTRAYYLILVLFSPLFVLGKSDLLFERCTSASDEHKENSDPFCYGLNRTDKNLCAGIINWASCVREATKHMETPGAKITKPERTQFRYDRFSRSFCFQPQLEVGESIRSFRGFVLNEVYIGKHPEHVFTLGCIFYPDFEITRQILNRTFCCTKLPQEWDLNGDIYFKVNGNSIPYTFGDPQIYSDYIPLWSLIPPPFSEKSPDPPPNDHMLKWIHLGVIVPFIALLLCIIYIGCKWDIFITCGSVVNTAFWKCISSVERLFNRNMREGEDKEESESNELQAAIEDAPQADEVDEDTEL